MSTSIGSGADEHKARLSAFQGGEERFVWGLDKHTGDLWFLEDDTATESRAFVNERVVCPVPGCAAKLTTAHRTKKRDGLQHFSRGGGHSRESIFHSQGCALIEDWLRRSYPRSTARREEYTNERGERRADVLLTGPDNDRIAFEVQYSSITPDAWQRRHDSYRQQGVVDVWLFGHTPNQLKIAPDGIVHANPTHEAVVRSGQALMFLNPDLGVVGAAVGVGHPFDADADRYLDERVPVFNELASARLEIRSLTELRPSTRHGLGGEWLEALYARTSALDVHNTTALAHAAENRERQRQEREVKQRTWELRRRPQQERIRALFGGVERWSRSEALAEIRAYFGVHLKGRIDYIVNPTSPPELLVRWQCVIYFELIAGQSNPFGARDAFRAIERRGIGMSTDGFKQVVRYLYQLEEGGFLRQMPGYGRYSTFAPTTSGAWW